MSPEPSAQPAETQLSLMRITCCFSPFLSSFPFPFPLPDRHAAEPPLGPSTPRSHPLSRASKRQRCATAHVDTAVAIHRHWN